MHTTMSANPQLATIGFMMGDISPLQSTGLPSEPISISYQPRQWQEGQERLNWTQGVKAVNSIRNHWDTY